MLLNRLNVKLTLRLLSLVLAVSLFTISSCDEDDPEILAINPTSGYPGNNVTITGNRFDPASTTVSFRGAEAVIVSITETEIVAKVPASSDTGPVVIHQGGIAITGPIFTYKKLPAITISEPTLVQTNEATLNANVTSTGTEGSTGVGFSYAATGGGQSSVTGGIKTATGPFSVRLTGLTKNTTYRIQAYATASDTTVNTEEITFTTANTNEWAKSSDTFTGTFDAIFSLSMLRAHNHPVAGNKAYLIPTASSGTGGALVVGLYEFDPGKNAITRMPDFAGTYRDHLARFAIGNKVYLGMGQMPTGALEIPADIWSFTPETKVWTRVKDFGGTPMASPASITIGGDAYVGFGPGHVGFETTFWAYNAAADTWTQKATPLTGGLVLQRVIMAVAVGGKGYFVFQRGPNEVWEYAPVTNTWTKKANFTGTVEGLNSGSVHPFNSFATTTRGYFCDPGGNIWEYAPTTDTWKQLPSPPNKSTYSFATAIENRIYVGSQQGGAYVYVPE